MAKHFFFFPSKPIIIDSDICLNVAMLMSLGMCCILLIIFWPTIGHYWHANFAFSSARKKILTFNLLKNSILECFFLEVMLSYYKSSCTFGGCSKMKRRTSLLLEKFPVHLHLGVRLRWRGQGLCDLGPAQLERSRPRHAVIEGTSAFLGCVDIDHKYLDVVILSKKILGCRTSRTSLDCFFQY